MLRNYLKITIRNIVRHKGYSFITIAGLAVGMACCLLFILYYVEETSYDRYHADRDRVFRIAQVSQPLDAETSSAVTTAALTTLLKEKFPQVELAARAMERRSAVIRREQDCFYESNVFWSESELFGILTIPFVEGNPQSALDRPSTAVICEALAHRYFGTTKIIGQMLRIGSADYEITGVVANAPHNTHFQYSLFISLKTLEGVFPYFNEWGAASFYTYVKLAPGADVTALTAAINTETRPFTDAAGSQDNMIFVLQPVASVHLESHLRDELDRPGSPLVLTIVLLVGILVLGIACLNFANLMTARSSLRAKEVALRYSVGAVRGQLFRQLLGESIVFSALACAIAVVMTELLLPLARSLTGAHLDTGQILQPNILLIIMGTLLGTGLLAGIYPAFVLTGFRPAVILKGTSIGDLRKKRARWLLVTGQLAIAVAFVAFAVTVFGQIRHMQQIPLGYSSGDRMVARVTLRRGQDYRTFKHELQRLPEIAGITASSTVPGVRVSGFWSTWQIDGDANTAPGMNYLYCDEDFIDEYGLQVVAGRGFSKSFTADSARSCLVNLAALPLLGLDSPEKAIGVEIFCGTEETKRTIIGVIDNFHFQGLQQVVEPLVMDLDPSGTRYLSLRLKHGDTKTAIASISSAWRKAFPDNPFDWFLLDDQFNLQYQSERRFGGLMLAATGLGLIIACLGLIGLTAFAAARRSKEIGIRKVLGASNMNVVWLLIRDFGKAVVVAYIIGWPIAYWVMDRWLQNFAYRTSIGIGTFLLSGSIVLVAGLLTVSYQAFKAAGADPVDTLKYE